MGLEIEDRASDSPYVERVWRSRSREVDRMVAVASPRWALVFWWQSGRTGAAVIGPESRASYAPVPEDATFFGIDFALGTTMPQLPINRLVDGSAELPDTTTRSFRINGDTWDIPDYDNAEAFVCRLVREELLVRDRLVAEVCRGATPELSTRTVQRHFLAATGLTRGAVRQIDRARLAALDLADGVPASDVIARLDYYDQPHLVRSLRRYVGRAPRELGRRLDGAPLSLLYKT